MTATKALGAIYGRVVSAARQDTLLFIIHDNIFNKPVICRLDESTAPSVCQIKKGVRVVVSGEIERDEITGLAFGISLITQIEILTDSSPEPYQDACGVWRADLLSDEKPESIIRRTRDAD